MKIKKNFELIEFADDYMLIPVSDEMDDFNGVVILNETSYFVLEQLKQNTTVENIIDSILIRYDTEYFVAQNDVTQIVAKLRELNVIED